MCYIIEWSSEWKGELFTDWDEEISLPFWEWCAASVATFVKSLSLFADWFRTLLAVKHTSATFSAVGSRYCTVWHMCEQKGSSAYPVTQLLSSCQIFVCPSLSVCPPFLLLCLLKSISGKLMKFPESLLHNIYMFFFFQMDLLFYCEFEFSNIKFIFR